MFASCMPFLSAVGDTLILSACFLFSPSLGNACTPWMCAAALMHARAMMLCHDATMCATKLLHALDACDALNVCCHTEDACCHTPACTCYKATPQYYAMMPQRVLPRSCMHVHYYHTFSYSHTHACKQLSTLVHTHTNLHTHTHAASPGHRWYTANRAAAGRPSCEAPLQSRVCHG